MIYLLIWIVVLVSVGVAAILYDLSEILKILNKHEEDEAKR